MGFFFNRRNTAESTIKVNYNGKDAQKGLSRLEKTIKTVISAYVIKQMATYTVELGKLGATSELVSKNFENFAKRNGKTVDNMMGDLRRASLGMVNDLELQQRAMQAMVGGVKFDDIIVAMEFVTKFASATGTDVSQKMMTVMTGLARGSAQFLDDVGIQVMGSKDVVNDAIAQMKEKMDQFATSEEDASVKAGQLKASFDNLKVSVGKLLQPVFNNLIKHTTTLIDQFSMLADVTNFEKKASKLKQVEFAQRMLNLAVEQENKVKEKLVKQNKDIKKYREWFVKSAVSEASVEKHMVFDKEKKLEIEKDLAKATEVRIKLEKNLNRVLRGGDKVDSNDFLKARLKEQRKLIDDAQKSEEEANKKKKTKKITYKTVAVYEGFAEGLKEREKLLREAEEREKEIEEEYIEQRLIAYKQLNNIGLTETEAKINEELKQLDDWKNKEVITIEEYNKLKKELDREYTEEQARIYDEKNRERLTAQKLYNNLGLSETEIRIQEEMALLDDWRKNEIITFTEYEALKTDLLRQESEERIRIVEMEEKEKIALSQKSISSLSTINNAIISMIDIRAKNQIEKLEQMNLSEEEFAASKERIMEESKQKRRAFARIEQGIAIAEATVDVYKAAAGVFADTPGNIIVRALAMAGAIADGMVTVAMIEQQGFQNGVVGLGGVRTSKQPDTINARIGLGESVISAPQTAMHEDTLRSIQNNTANTARGMKQINKGDIVNNFYGVSTEQLLSVSIDVNRRKRIGRRI